MSAYSGRTVAVVGAAGHHGSLAVRMLARAADRPRRLLAVDRAFAAAAGHELNALGAEIVQLDAASERSRLAALLHDADLVLNFAGPFFVLGSTVLECAIEARCDYVDIGDDAAAAAAMLALADAARAAEVTALIGGGSAPGVTNVLGRLALDVLARDAGAVPAAASAPQLVIAWATPVTAISESIFRHIGESLLQPLHDGPRATRWEDLVPRAVEFPAPLGALETVLFGHPEPTTFAALLGVPVELRGAMVPPALMRSAFDLALALERGDRTPATAHREFLAGVRDAVPASFGALHVEAWRGEIGIRIQTASDDPMAETTVGPCLAFGRIVLGHRALPAGVVAPELLPPAQFLAHGGAGGRGQVAAWRLRAGEAPERTSFGALVRSAA